MDASLQKTQLLGGIMALIDDIIIDTTNLRIAPGASIVASTFYTARSLYSLLMDLFDEQGVVSQSGAMALNVPISAQTPTDFTIVNGWYLSGALTKNLSGGSIQTSGYTGAIYILYFGATYTAAVPTDIGKTVVSGANTGVLLDIDNTTKKWRVRATAGTWGNSLAVTITGGTGTGTTLAAGGSATGEAGFSNVFSIGSIVHGNMFFSQGSAITDGTGWYTTGNSTGGGSVGSNLHLDILVRIREGGSILNSGLVTLYNRSNKSASGAATGDTYDFTTVDLSGFGRNTVALSTAADAADTLTDAAIAAYVAVANGGTGVTASIAVTFGSFTADVNADGTVENYIAKVDCVTQPLSIVYQALKWLNRKASTSTLNGTNGSIYTIAAGGYTPVKAEPFGSFAGGKLFFAQGVYPVNVAAADASNYQTIDTVGSSYTPPSFVSVAVSGVLSGDRVSVFQLSGSAVNKSQFVVATGNNTGNATMVLTTAIPADTPATGVIRVLHAATQTEQQYPYSSLNAGTKTFTLNAVTLTRTYVNTDNAYVPYIDATASGSSVAVSLQFVSTRNIRAVVRNGAGANKIVPFSVDGVIASTGFSVPATRTADTINTTP